MLIRWRYAVFPILLILLGLSIACLCMPLSDLQYIVEKVEPEADVNQTPRNTCPSGMTYNSDTQACEAQLDCSSWLAELEDQFRDPPAVNEEAPAYDDETFLVTYTINAGQIGNPIEENVPAYLETYQNEHERHKAIWLYFATLFPENTWRDLTSFAIMTDGEDNALAAIERSWDNPEKWQLSVDIVDAADTNELISTLIHEFGHLLTLNVGQVDPYEVEQECPTYYAGDGCSLPAAYLTDFFNQFWLEIYNEWIDIQAIENDDDYYDALDAFYCQYREQFVTDYAVASPEEDIAESWTLFILAPVPVGVTIAEQKILFFYKYPGLVRLREEILSRLCTQTP